MKSTHTSSPAISNLTIGTLLAIAATLVSSAAQAAILNAPASGTFTMNLDRNALAPYYGYFLANFWDGASSDYANPVNSGPNLSSLIATTEISALNQVFDLTPIGSQPLNQAGLRHVQATSPTFSIDSSNLAGVAGATVGLTGVQGFYAPYFPHLGDSGQGGGVLNGDFSVVYDASRQANGQSGWYLANNIYFTMAVYDFSNLSIAFTDANNWQLSGDLLMSPENGGMLQGASFNDVGDFCLGTGSFAGCGQVSTIPVPGAIWLFGSGLFGYIGLKARKSAMQILSYRENS